ncbi:BatD family protein [candidate division KSB1 bacterium]
MKYTIHKILLIFSAVILSTGEVNAQDIQVSATFNQNFAVENQEIMLIVTIEGSKTQEASAPEMPDFGEWFAFGGPRGTSQSVSMVNGRVTSQYSYNYGLIPLKTGMATVPEITVRVGSREFKSKSFEIEIKGAGSAPPPASNTRRRTDPGSRDSDEPLDLFLEAVPEKNTVYQNEGFTVDYKVFIGDGVSVSQYTPLNVPNFPGFWSEEYTINSRPTTHNELYNNKNYKTATLKRIELYPTRSGELELDPIQMEFRAETQSVRRRDIRSFLNDPFLDRARNVRVASNKIKINVKPLPVNGKPANFDGLVGQYDVKADVDVKRVKENESVTLSVTVSGAGNIKLIGEPDLRISGVFEKYDPTVNETINRSGNAISGSKTFEYVIIPRTEGELRISPLSIAYFDPNTETYRTSVTAPIAI